ncbi:MAG: hypothetical protein HQK55_16245, partial [Deltaproteobacteria bacterium]|nr:hypothetical protein [Deltaproteobacteria bacterium]
MKLSNVPQDTSRILAMFAFVTFLSSKTRISAVFPSNRDFPGPLGLPNFFPEALILDKGIFVRWEMRSRSSSANKEKMVTMTLEAIS